MSITAQAVHGLKVCVIPNPENDFRPWALRHKSLAAMAALMLIAKIVAASAIALVPASAELSTITSATIVQFTNAERRKAGVGDLKVNSLLASAAAQKAQHMLDKDYFAHISPDGVTPWFWMAKVGYQYDIAGENLAIDFTEAEDVVAAWMASPTHKDNMLHAEYTETAVAVATGEFQGGTSTVVVHMFGRGVGSSAGKAASSTTVASPSPTPLSSPAPTVTPIPTPIPVPSDTTPPRTPRIALAGGGATVKGVAEITVEGEPGSAVRVLVNNQIRTTVRLPGSGTANQRLDVSALPEGTFIVRAYAVDAAGNESEISETLALTKDTLGPLIDERAIAFALSPNFDAPAVAAFLPVGQTQGWTVVGSPDAPLSITLTDEIGNETQLADLSFTPQFLSDIRQDELTLPSRAQAFSRRLAAVLAATLAILLVLTILIRVRIQRPALIAHASLVILFAIGLFLV